MERERSVRRLPSPRGDDPAADAATPAPASAVANFFRQANHGKPLGISCKSYRHAGPAANKKLRHPRPLPIRAERVKRRAVVCLGSPQPPTTIYLKTPTHYTARRQQLARITQTHGQGSSAGPANLTAPDDSTCPPTSRFRLIIDHRPAVVRARRRRVHCDAQVDPVFP